MKMITLFLFHPSYSIRPTEQIKWARNQILEEQTFIFSKNVVK